MKVVTVKQAEEILNGSIARESISMFEEAANKGTVMSPVISNLYNHVDIIKSIAYNPLRVFVDCDCGEVCFLVSNGECSPVR